jgi:hypothetical protein
MPSHLHVPGCARLNVMRLNAARLNYYEPIPLAIVGGVDRTRNVRIEAAQVAHVLNDAPDTGAVRVHGFAPVAGQLFDLYTGDRSTNSQLFGGRILETSVLYESIKKNVAYDLALIDHTWLLNRLRVLFNYQNVTATAMIIDVVSRFAPGFTVKNVAAGLPLIDAITFTNDTVATALTAICERIGAYWYADYDGDIHAGLTESVTAAPITDANPRGSSGHVLSEDLSQVVTRILARGGGGQAFVDVASGAAELPVTDDGWYSDAGGIVEVAATRVTYTGVKGRGGTGALVGVASIPSSPLDVRVANGAGLAPGIYKYAQTFTNAAGETLTGPQATATTGSTAPSLFPTTARSRGSVVMPPGMTPGGSYSWRVAVLYEGGGYALGPATPYYTVDSSEWELYFGIPVVDPVTGYSYNPGLQSTGLAKILQTQIYRTTNGGAVYYSEKNYLSEGVPTINGWNTTANNFTDAAIVARPQYPAGPVASFNAVVIRNIQAAPAGMTGTKIYRTAAGGAQLKLLVTNPPVDYTDTVADAALGANVPTTDTAGVAPTNAQVPVGSTTLPVTSIAPFVADGGAGWAAVGTMPIRYTGASGGQLTGLPALGEGSITATIRHGAQVLVVARLVGIPVSGAGALIRAVTAGDAVTIRVEVEDTAAQAAFAARLGLPASYGIVEEPFTDSRMTSAELLNYARALLTDRKDPRRTLRFQTRDPSCEVGRLISVTMTTPPISGTFRIQRVGFSEIAITGGLARVAALRTVEASNKIYTFADLLRRLRGREGGAG